MGIAYALVKQDQPEVFNLGKGLPTLDGLYGWPAVFGRRFGSFLPNSDGSGNFTESFQIDPDLVEQIVHFNRIGEPAASKIAERIQKWAGTSNLFLINYWEEIEYYQEDQSREDCDNEFSDLRPQLVCSLYDYKLVASIWKD